jgi:hypothetical protein
MADATLGLITHPLAVVAYVLGQALRPSPRAAVPDPPTRRGVHGRPAAEARRDLDHRLVDQHRHRIQITGVRFQAQALRLQRQCAPAGERVMKRGQRVTPEKFGGPRVVGVVGAGAAPALPDLVARGLQHLLVGGVLPLHQFADDVEQALALQVGRAAGQRGRLARRVHRGVTARLRLLPRAAAALPQCLPILEFALGAALERGVRQQGVDVGGGVVDHLREDHGPRSSQRTPRPPQVQRARVPVADALLARAGSVDGVERQGDFDEFLAAVGGGLGHQNCSRSASRKGRLFLRIDSIR